MANKNLFTKFASLAMAGALAFSAVPVAGLSGVLKAEAANGGNYTLKMEKANYVYDGEQLTGGDVASVSTGNPLKNHAYDTGADFKFYKENDAISNSSANITNAGTYNVVVNSASVLTDEAIGTITVEKRNIGDSVKAITLSNSNAVYNGYPQRADAKSFTFVKNDKSVSGPILTKDNTDGIIFTDLGENHTDAGSYTESIDATVSKNFAGTANYTFTISKYNLAGNAITTADNAFADGKPNIQVGAVLSGTKVTTLKEGTDYEVEYTAGIDAGNYTVRGINNFIGESTGTYKIVDSEKNVAAADVVLNNTEFTYDGTVKKATIKSIKIGNKTLTAGTDYEVRYSNDDEDEYNNPKSAGEVVMTIVGKGSYAGTKTLNYTINPKAIDKVTFAVGGGTQTYDGDVHEPTITASGLEEDTDFVVSYENNVNAGTATASIIGMGNYTGTTSKDFKIEAVSITSTDIETISNQIYNGNPVEPAVVVKHDFGTAADPNVVTLEKDVDYTVAYKNNDKTGTGTVIVTGINNYKGAPTKTFTIKGPEFDLANAVVTLVQDSVDYDGKPHTPSIKSVVVTDATGKEKTLTTEYNATKPTETNAGEYFVIIKPSAGSSYGGEKSVPFKINALDASNAKVELEKTSYTYNGKKFKPAVKSVTLADDTVLAEDSYDVAYTNNKNAGTGTVTVTAKGNYTGESTATFKIKKADQPMKVSTKTASVKASKVAKKNQTIKASKVFSVSKNQGSVSYKKTSGNSKIKVASNGKITVKKGLKKGTYKIKVKVTAKGNSNYNSGSKTATFKIKVK